jgi:glycosyltransferase involved in cell wall biosynthesis
VRVLAVIPAFNEERFIGAVVRRVRVFVADVLVVDDGSGDATAERAREAGARVLPVRPNRGKGHALASGFRVAVDEGYDAAVQMDADGQHAPEDLPALTAAGAEADLVVGARRRAGTPMPWLRRQVNASCSALLSMLTGARLSDVHSGYRLIRRDVLAAVRCRGTAFDFEVEYLIRAARAGFRIRHAPIRTLYGEQASHIDPWKDTLKFFRAVGYHALGFEQWTQEFRAWAR